jgi:3-hydroxyisobutyrate dehydrogenase-like beta-hydroxyacid dehydrogenase
VSIAFIGLGNMGSGMCANQAKAGRAVRAFDLSAAALERRGKPGRGRGSASRRWRRGGGDHHAARPGRTCEGL